MSWSDISEMVTAVAVLTGVWIAGRGLHSWREQLRGTSERELAVNAKKSAIRLRSAFRQTRSLFNDWNQEGTFNEAQARERYFKPLSDAYTDLHDKTLELCAATSLDHDKLMLPFRKLVVEMDTSIHGHFGFSQSIVLYRGIKTNDGERKYVEFRDLLDEVDKVLRDMGTIEQPDEFSKRINDVYATLVREFDRLIKPSEKRFWWQYNAIQRFVCRPFRAWKKKKN